jgi:hypothetical protein
MEEFHQSLRPPLDLNVVDIYVILFAILGYVLHLSEHAALTQDFLDGLHDRLRLPYFHFTLVTIFGFGEQIFYVWPLDES